MPGTVFRALNVLIHFYPHTKPMREILLCINASEQMAEEASRAGPDAAAGMVPATWGFLSGSVKGRPRCTRCLPGSLTLTTEE